MSFDLEKMQAVAELGEVIRLQNEALERLQAFRKARPYMMMPNLAKMVEENLKENVMVLYKELNNLHKPAEKQTRHVCRECHMAFISPLPGGICDECRARKASGGPREYVPYQGGSEEDEDLEAPIEENGETLSHEQQETADEIQEPEAEKAVPEETTAADETAAPDEPDAPARAGSEEQGTENKRGADSIESLYAASISDSEPEEEQEDDEKRASGGAAAEEDNYDNPGDEIELANPAPDVAAPEGVEGIPDTDTDDGTTHRRTDSNP